MRINQDLLKTRDRCLKAARAALEEGKSVAIDATNPDEATRAHWVGLARDVGVQIRSVHFVAGKGVCRHNDVVRALNLEVGCSVSCSLSPLFFQFSSAFYLVHDGMN